MSYDGESYDTHQMNTTLRTCPKCERKFFMRPGRVLCVSCSGGKRAEAEAKRVSDVSGVPLLYD